MKKNQCVFLICMAVVLTSCLENGNKTFVLPDVVYATPIEDVIPAELLEDIEGYMSIYKGKTPPDIEGVYLVNPDELVYTSDGVFQPGRIFADDLFKFSSQNSATNIVTYASKQANSEQSSEKVSVSGTKENFTAYFIATGTSNDIYVKTSTVISGAKTSAGIQNYQMAFIMLEKGADPNGKLMDVNEFRIFKDGNGLASNSTWEEVSKVKTVNALKNTDLTKPSIFESNKQTER